MSLSAISAPPPPLLHRLCLCHRHCCPVIAIAIAVCWSVAHLLPKTTNDNDDNNDNDNTDNNDNNENDNNETTTTTTHGEYN